jgi:hypothetical protein
MRMTLGTGRGHRIGVAPVVAVALCLAAGVMLLDLRAHTDSVGHLLADAGQAIAGRAGFVVISAAALLATASAVNATSSPRPTSATAWPRTGRSPQPLTRPEGRSATWSYPWRLPA